MLWTLDLRVSDFWGNLPRSGISSRCSSGSLCWGRLLPVHKARQHRMPIVWCEIHTGIKFLFQDLHDLISQEVFTYQRPKTSNWMVPKTSQKLFPLRVLPWAPLVFKTHQPLIFVARNQVSDWIVLATTSAAEHSISAAVAHLMATPTRCVSDGAVSGPVSWSWVGWIGDPFAVIYKHDICNRYI